MKSTRNKNPKPALSPVAFSDAHDKAHIEAICAAAGTTYNYWKRIRDRRQRPSVDLAQALVRESGGELDLMALLFPKTALRGAGAPPLRVTQAPQGVAA